MPYRHAHYYLLLLIPLILLAFWPRYFAVMPGATIALHIHAFTGSLWIGLLAFQSWSIHNRHNEWHRATGIASLAVFPFFFAGGLLVVHSMAGRFATHDNPLLTLFGARLATVDFTAVVAVAFLYWSGLRWRRKVHLHARYMLATILFLFIPTFGRLSGRYVPGLMSVPPDFANFPLNVEFARLVTLLIALALAGAQPKYSRPWLIAAGFVGLEMVLFVTLGEFGPWETLVRAFGSLPAPLLFSTSLAVGALISWLGWSSVPPRRAIGVEAV